ncbi:peroxiredoxin [Spizellomyces sp. 'palustris']|nr:peroxiredoxin [Spizellomyces sp. 'palustris']
MIRKRSNNTFENHRTRSQQSITIQKQEKNKYMNRRSARIASRPTPYPPTNPLKPPPPPTTTLKTQLNPPTSALKGQTVDTPFTPFSAPLLDDTGTEVDIGSEIDSTGTVFFVYPRANTPGCTKQAIGFRDHYQEIKEKGYKVFGISGDSVSALQKWKNKLELPYQLLSDPSLAFISHLGCHKPPKKIVRSHIVVDKGGRVRQVCVGVSPVESFEKVLKVL